MTGKTKYIKGVDGKMKGSIGSGKTPPQSAPVKMKAKPASSAQRFQDIKSGYILGRTRPKAELLAMLEPFKSLEILEIAGNTQTPEDMLLILAEDKNLMHMDNVKLEDRKKIVSAAYRNTGLSTASLDKIYDARYPTYYETNKTSLLLANPNLSPRTIRKIALQEPHVNYPLYWLTVVADHPNCPEDLRNISLEARGTGHVRFPVITRAFVEKIIALGPHRRLLVFLMRNQNVDKSLFYYLIPERLDGYYEDDTRVHPEILRAIVRYSPATPERQKATDILAGYKGRINKKVVIQKTQDADLLYRLVVNNAQGREHRELALLNRSVPEEAEVVAAMQGEDLRELRSRRPRT